MARGFSSLGSGATDRVVTPLTAHYAQIAFSVRTRRVGNGGNSAGRLLAKEGEFEFLTSSDGTMWYEVGYSSSWSEWQITGLPTTGTDHVLVIIHDKSSPSNDPIVLCNNVLLDVRRDATGSGSLLSNSNPYVIGNRANAGTYARVWDGIISEVMFWDHAITLSVAQRVSAGFDPRDVGDDPEAYYPLCGDASPEPDAMGGSSATVTGALPATHPEGIQSACGDPTHGVTLVDFDHVEDAAELGVDEIETKEFTFQAGDLLVAPIHAWQMGEPSTAMDVNDDINGTWPVEAHSEATGTGGSIISVQEASGAGASTIRVNPPGATARIWSAPAQFRVPGGLFAVVAADDEESWATPTGTLSFTGLSADKTYILIGSAYIDAGDLKGFQPGNGQIVLGGHFAIDHYADLFCFRVVSGVTSATLTFTVQGSDFFQRGMAGVAIEVQPPVPEITAVTPDEIADGASILIDGSGFGADEGTVVISPIDDPAGEPTTAVTFSASAVASGNPTTSATITVPTVVAGQRVFVAFATRDHTSGDAQPTVTDDNGGAAWVQDFFRAADRRAQLWSKPYEAGLSGKTITVAGAIGSLAPVCFVLSDVYGSSGYITDLLEETSSPGDETHAAITPTNAGSAVVFIVYNTGGNRPVSNQAAATSGAADATFQKQSTGGSDCVCSVAVWDDHPASSTGAFTWDQTNGTTYSIAFAVRPRTPAGAAVEQTVSGPWTDDEITFTADHGSLALGVAYAFVQHDNGTWSAGYPVTLVEGSGGEPELLSVRSATPTRSAVSVSVPVRLSVASHTGARTAVAASVRVAASVASRTGSRSAIELSTVPSTLSLASRTSTRTTVDATVVVGLAARSVTASRTAVGLEAGVALAVASRSGSRSNVALAVVPVALAGRSATATRTHVTLTTEDVTSLAVRSATPTRTAIDVTVAPTTLGVRSATGTRTAVGAATTVSLSAASRAGTRTVVDLSVAPVTLGVRSATSTRTDVRLATEDIASVTVRSATSTRTAVSLTGRVVSLGVRSATSTRTTVAVAIGARLSVRSATSTRTRVGVAVAPVTLAVVSRTSTRTSVALRQVAALSIRSRTATRTAVAVGVPMVRLPMRSATSTRTAVELTVLQLTIPVDQVVTISVLGEDRSIAVAADDRVFVVSAEDRTIRIPARSPAA